MPSLSQRLQRRLLVLLAWLVLAVSVAPAAEFVPARAQAVLVASALGVRAAGHGGAAPAGVVPPAPRAAVASSTPAAHASRPGAAVVALASQHTRSAAIEPRRTSLPDGRHLYLSNLRLLC